MASQLKLEISVDDKGTVVLKQFSDTGKQSLGQIGDAAKSQMGVVDQLQNHWVAAGAAIAAAWMTVNKAVEYMDAGAKALQIESSFRIMAESSAVNADKMIANMRSLTRQTIDDSDLMQKSIKLMTMGYDPAQIERFSSVVVTASQIVGQTVGETYDTLADAIATKMPRALVRMGAVTREQMKVVNAAVAAGASEMSLYELSMANLELKTLQLRGTQDQATVALQAFHAEVKEAKETVGKYAIEGVQVLWEGLKKLGGAAYDVAAGFASIRAGNLEQEAIKATAAYDKYFESATGEAKQTLLTNMVNTQYLADQKFLESETMRAKARQMMGFESDGEIKNITKATAAELASSQAQVDARLEALRAEAEALKAAEAYAKAYEKLGQEELKTIADRKKYESTFYEWKSAEIEVSLVEFEKAGLREVDIDRLRTEKLKTLHAELYQHYGKIMADWTADTHKKTQAMVDETEKTNIETLVSYKTMYEGIQARTQELYNIKDALLITEANKFFQITQDYAASEAWLAEQREKLWIEYAKTTDSVMRGIKAGMLEMQRNLYTWGQAGYDMFKTFAQSSQSVISSVLFDGIKGQLKSFSDYWQSFTDAMLKKFVDIVAQMAVEWATAQLFMKQTWFGNSLTGVAGGTAAAAAAGGYSVIPAAGGGYMLASAGAGGSAAAAYGSGLLATETNTVATATSMTEASQVAAGLPQGQFVEILGEGGTQIGVMEGTVASTGWMAGLSAAAPYLAAALLADQILFGGKGTNAIVGGISSAGSAVGDAASSVWNAVTSIFHGGGIVGTDYAPTRDIPAFAFAGAPRLHSGFAPDEFPAILQQGERVLSRKQNASYEGGGVVINFNVGGNIVGDQRTWNDFTKKIQVTLDEISRRRIGVS